MKKEEQIPDKCANPLENPEGYKEFLRTNGAKRKKAVEEMQKLPVDWEAIDRQIDESFRIHGQVNPNKKGSPDIYHSEAAKKNYEGATKAYLERSLPLDLGKTQEEILRNSK